MLDEIPQQRDNSTSESDWALGQSCQMVYFQAKNPNFGKIWRALEWKMLLYFMTIWNIKRPFGIIYGLTCGQIRRGLWSFGIFFPVLVCLDREKSGNPALGPYSESCR
jgi:hypothetical protein